MFPCPREVVKPPVVWQYPHSPRLFVGVDGKGAQKFKKPPTRDGLTTTKGKAVALKKGIRKLSNIVRRESKYKTWTVKWSWKLEERLFLTVGYGDQSVELFFLCCFDRHKKFSRILFRESPLNFLFFFTLYLPHRPFSMIRLSSRLYSIDNTLLRPWNLDFYVVTTTSQ